MIALTAAVTLATGATSGAAATPATSSAVTIEAQTYNLDLGADLTPLFGATSIPTLRDGAAAVFAAVQASRPQERMQAVAKIISRQRPDAIGLQEVALWKTAPYIAFPAVTGAYTTAYDFLDLLLADLTALGTPYEAVSTNVTFDSGVLPIPVPISDTTAASYVDRNVVLVSTALKKHVTVSNNQQADFATNFTVNLLGVTVRVGRGWASVDITARSRTFRFIDTHLEAYGVALVNGQPTYKDQIRNPQAAELARIVTASPHPTIVVGDINARPTMCATWRQPPLFEDGNTVAYATLQSAGLTEVWPMVHPEEPCDPAGWTSGQDSLVGATSTLTHRIDEVFLSSGFSALQTAVVGDSPAERSRPHGLWPSDHASTVAKVRLDAATTLGT